MVNWKRAAFLVAFALIMLALGAALAAIVIDERASRNVAEWEDRK